MDKVWKKMTETIAIALKRPEIPPVIRGARGLIETLCREEEKLEKSIEKAREKNYVTQPSIDIASIVSKYGTRDVYKDIYQFIKA